MKKYINPQTLVILMQNDSLIATSYNIDSPNDGPAGTPELIFDVFE